MYQCTEYIGKNNQYKYYATVDTLITLKYTGLATIPTHGSDKHPNYELWDFYLLRLCDAMLVAQSGQVNNSDNNLPRYLSTGDMKQTCQAQRNKPILTCDTLKAGFYHNFQEFETNNPTFTYDSESNLKKLLEVMHYRVGKTVSNEAPDTSFWGYSDGKKIFVRYQYNFFELEKHDCAFYIAPTLDARRKYLNRQGWNMLIGLAVLTTGIVAKEGITFTGFNAVQMPDTPVVALPFANGYATGVVLDMYTGKITF